jgi:hypothetical protein
MRSGKHWTKPHQKGWKNPTIPPHSVSFGTPPFGALAVFSTFSQSSSTRSCDFLRCSFAALRSSSTCAHIACRRSLLPAWRRLPHSRSSSSARKGVSRAATGTAATRPKSSFLLDIFAVPAVWPTLFRKLEASDEVQRWWTRL